ncbi:hypothetical protein BKA56DRAFT_590789 [Ilyonectria sp. MPI-CAGE-AT-0026]|nr:hypothetical protein BKA56DRAFT_590789 [Ilyonectria sp. MPI-CAGE-AT-0026]
MSRDIFHIVLAYMIHTSPSLCVFGTRLPGSLPSRPRSGVSRAPASRTLFCGGIHAGIPMGKS